MQENYLKARSGLERFKKVAQAKREKRQIVPGRSQPQESRPQGRPVTTRDTRQGIRDESMHFILEKVYPDGTRRIKYPSGTTEYFTSTGWNFIFNRNGTYERQYYRYSNGQGAAENALGGHRNNGGPGATGSGPAATGPGPARGQQQGYRAPWNYNP